MGGMGRADLGVGLAVAALLLGGCGGGASSTPLDPTTGRTTGSAPAGTSPPPRSDAGSGVGSEASYGPQFPLTLRRTGGSAGFDDSVVLDANGRVRVDTRSVHGRVCRLEPGLKSQLLSLLATLRLGTGTTSTTDPPAEQTTPVDGGVAESDPITISVTDDRARSIDLSDPSLGEISGLVGTLVGDVTLSVPAVTRCTTPTATSVAPAP